MSLGKPNDQHTSRTETEFPSITQADIAKKFDMSQRQHKGDNQYTKRVESNLTQGSERKRNAPTTETRENTWDSERWRQKIRVDKMSTLKHRMSLPRNLNF